MFKIDIPKSEVEKFKKLVGEFQKTPLHLEGNPTLLYQTELKRVIAIPSVHNIREKQKEYYVQIYVEEKTLDSLENEIWFPIVDSTQKIEAFQVLFEMMANNAMGKTYKPITK